MFALCAAHWVRSFVFFFTGGFQPFQPCFCVFCEGWWQTFQQSIRSWSKSLGSSDNPAASSCYIPSSSKFHWSPRPHFCFDNWLNGSDGGTNSKRNAVESLMAEQESCRKWTAQILSEDRCTMTWMTCIICIRSHMLVALHFDLWRILGLFWFAILLLWTIPQWAWKC